MLFFKSKEQKEQAEQERLLKKLREHTMEAEAQERFDALQERLSPLKKEKHKSEIILNEIYGRHGKRIYLIGSSDTIIDEAYLSDEIIDDLCLFTEEERKSLHKWAKCYKDCERHIIKMLEDYKKEEDEHSINDNM